MKSRLAVASLSAATAALLALALPGLGPYTTPTTQAQVAPAAYEIEVLPGVGATGAPTDLAVRWARSWSASPAVTGGVAS